MNLIVFSSKNPFANPGAASNRLLGLLIGLSELGVDVRLLILQGYFSENEHLEYSVEGKRNGINYVYLSKRENITIWQRRISEYFYVFFEELIVSKKVNAFLKIFSKNSIIWLQDSPICYSLAKKSNINQHKMFLEMNEYPDAHKDSNSQKYIWQRWLLDRKIETFYKDVLHRLDGFALITEALIEHFKGQLNKRTKILHLPMTVELDRFDPSRKYDRIENLDAPYIAFVGSMDDAKDGVNLLIEAFALISNEFPDYKLALFGFWAYDTAKHQQRIKQLGIQDKVVYSKPIGSDRIVNLIMNAEVLVLPRPDSYQATGGFPTKLGEYLATSKPVIATRVGEIQNYLRHEESAFLIEPGSVESLVSALQEILTNPAKASKIGQGGRKVAESHFCSNIQSERLHQFLINELYKE
jgi:glycosyltransferase involved in cell wall biosynthesis